VGVFDRFERRLERLVEGAFGRVFKGEAVPADIARALQREIDDRRVVVGPGRVIAPNCFVVALGNHDHERLAPYAQPLGEAFGEMLQAHAQESGYSFAGPVEVRLEHDPSLEMGRFTIRSDPTPDPGSAGSADGGALNRPSPAAPPSTPSTPSAMAFVPRPRHRIVITDGGSADPPSAAVGGAEASVALSNPVTVVGRSASADVRLEDPGVSRRHAELHLVGDSVRLVDAGSTNGTRVNGEPITARQLRSGDRIQVGTTILLYRRAD